MIEWLLSPFTGNGSSSYRKEERSLPGVALLAQRTASVQPFRSALSALAAELDRARRYEHPFSLMVLSMHHATNGNGTDFASTEDVPPLETRVPHPMALVAGSILGEGLRESDIPTYDAVAQWFVVVLPQSTAEAARLAVRRLDRLLTGRMSIRVRAGVAVFPQDGLTLRELLESGETHWMEEPVPTSSGEASAEASGAASATASATASASTGEQEG